MRDRVEVITGRRKRYTEEEKQEFVKLTTMPGNSVMQVSRQFGITPSLLFKWRKTYRDLAINTLPVQPFTKVVLKTEASQRIENGGSVLVHIGNEIKITFPNTISLESLAAFVSVLRG